MKCFSIVTDHNLWSENRTEIQVDVIKSLFQTSIKFTFTEDN